MSSQLIRDGRFTSLALDDIASRTSHSRTAENCFSWLAPISFHLAITSSGKLNAAQWQAVQRSIQEHRRDQILIRIDGNQDESILGRSAFGQHPVLSRVMTGVASRVSHQVVLVLGFRFPEIARRFDFGNHLPRPQTDALTSSIVSIAICFCSSLV